MLLLRRFVNGVYRLFHRSKVEQDLDDEMRAYLDAAVEHKLAAGIPRTEAVRLARLEIGGVAQVKDATRDVSWDAHADAVWRDFTFAVRRLTRSPGFTLGAMVTLALGIGGNTIIYSVLRAASLDASAYPDPDRLAVMWSTQPGGSNTNDAARIVEYLAWRERTRAFDQVGMTMNWSSTVGPARDDETADRLAGYRFSASMFRALGVKPVLGRLFTEEDDRTDGPSNVVVISYRLWQQRFGGETSALGRTLRLDGTETTVVGVLPPSFRFFDGGQADFWIPMNFTRFQLQSRSANRVLIVIGHLKRGVSLSQAQADTDGIATQLALDEPSIQGGRTSRLQPFDDAMLGGVRQLLHILQGAVALVLLIACANIAGLLLIRGASRQKEVAIRCSLGASRRRIVGQFLTESLVLGVAGGVLGVALARVGIRLLTVARPTWLSPVRPLDLNAGVLLFSAVVSVLTGLAFGLLPAFRASTTNLVSRLKQSTGAASIARAGRGRLQGTLLAGQIALTLTLLVGAGLLIKSFWQLQRQNLGFTAEHVLLFGTRLPANQYFHQVGSQNGITLLDVSPVPARLFDEVRHRLAALPGVQAAGGTTLAPVSFGALQAPFVVEGRRTVDETGKPKNPTASYALITPDYFATMRIPIVKGRDFSDADVTGSLPVAIMNEETARRWWPNDDPIGEHLTVAIVPGEPPREIVGVVGNTPVNRFDQSPTPILYVPQLQESARYRTPFGQSRVQMAFVLRITEPLDVILPAIRRAVAAVDRSMPVTQAQMVDDYLAQQLEVPRDSMVVVVAFGAMALLLSAFGIYAIVAYGVVQRTDEIGLRMALGARPSQVLALVLRQSTLFTCLGMALGLIGAAASARFLTSLLFGLTPLDAATFMAVLLLFLAVVVCAAYLPASRATRLDPLTALRHE